MPSVAISSVMPSWLTSLLSTSRSISQATTTINDLSKNATGSASRIARMCLLAEPPTIDRGEVTDKGSINQRAVLAHRADTVAKLHDGTLQHILKPT